MGLLIKMLLQEGVAFIQDVIGSIEASKLADSQEPILYLNMQVAQYHLLTDNLAETKRLMNEGMTELDTLQEVRNE